MKQRKRAAKANPKGNGSETPMPDEANKLVDRQELMAGEEIEATDDGLREAESELGISDWIDPDTGGPAEDSVPHIEDH